MIAARRERQEAGGFAARLQQVLKDHGSASGLAKAIGRSEGAVRKWLRAEAEPNVTDLRAISEITHTRIEWLVAGEGRREPARAAVLDDPLVRETGAVYQSSSRATLDLPLLESVLTTLEGQLHATAIELTATKRAALIAAAYDIARDRNAVDAQAVARLLRLVR